jgi:DNA-binding response OmpR family regulator
LIVEDDPGVRLALERGLAREGFETIAVAAGAQALAVDAHDIALVDLGLPDQDGIEVCRQLRARHGSRPIIVVTARQDELDVVDALDAGADDFVTKPFSLAVLTVRIRRHLERASSVSVVGDLELDRAARRAMLSGKPLDLTAREFDVLWILARHRGETVTTRQLLDAAWDAHWSRSPHTLAVHISALRSKLRSAGDSSPSITAVPGIGYRLDAEPSNR